MTRLRIGLLLVAGVVVCSSATGGCASGAPRERPLALSRIDQGPGSLEATRRALQGSWTLVSLDVIDARGVRQPVKASGLLTYDAFGSMSIRGVIEDPSLQSTLVLDYSGRIVIDTARLEFRAADLVSDRPVEPGQIAPLSPDKVRRYELSGDVFIVTYLDASARPTAVARWRRGGA